MTTKKPRRTSTVPTAYYMGSMGIYVVAGGDEPPQVAIDASRLERAPDDKFWKIIASLPSTEYTRLDELISEMIEKLKVPGDLHPWPF
jgi:hypothetical protein